MNIIVKLLVLNYLQLVVAYDDSYEDYEIQQSDSDLGFNQLFDSLNLKPTPIYLCENNKGTQWRMPKIKDCQLVDTSEPSEIVELTLWYPDISQMTVNANLCWAVKTRNSKNWFFFGGYDENTYNTKVDISISDCNEMVRIKKSPIGETLKSINENVFGTNHIPKAEWSYNYETIVEVTNYYYIKTKLLINDQDKSVLGPVKFTEKCLFEKGMCNTEEGIVVWNPKTLKECRLKRSDSTICVQTGDRISCPEIQISMHGVNTKSICGTTLGSSEQGALFSVDKVSNLTKYVALTSKVIELTQSDSPKNINKTRGKRELDGVSFYDSTQINGKLQHCFDIVKNGTAYALQLFHSQICHIEQFVLRGYIYLAETGFPTIIPRSTMRNKALKGRLSGDIIEVIECTLIHAYRFLNRTECIAEYPVEYTHNSQIRQGYLKPLSHQIVEVPTEIECPPNDFIFETIEGKTILLRNRSEITNLPIFPMPLGDENTDHKMLPSVTFTGRGNYKASELNPISMMIDYFDTQRAAQQMDAIIKDIQKGKFTTQQRKDLIKSMVNLVQTPFRNLLRTLLITAGTVSILLLIFIGFRLYLASAKGQAIKIKIQETINEVKSKFTKPVKADDQDKGNNGGNDPNQTEASIPTERTPPLSYPLSSTTMQPLEKILEIPVITPRVTIYPQFESEDNETIEQTRKKKKQPKLALPTNILPMIFLLFCSCNYTDSLIIPRNIPYQISSGADISQIEGTAYEYIKTITFAIDLTGYKEIIRMREEDRAILSSNSDSGIEELRYLSKVLTANTEQFSFYESPYNSDNTISKYPDYYRLRYTRNADQITRVVNSTISYYNKVSNWKENLKSKTKPSEKDKVLTACITIQNTLHVAMMAIFHAYNEIKSACNSKKITTSLLQHWEFRGILIDMQEKLAKDNLELSINYEDNQAYKDLTNSVECTHVTKQGPDNKDTSKWVIKILIPVKSKGSNWTFFKVRPLEFINPTNQTCRLPIPSSLIARSKERSVSIPVSNYEEQEMGMENNYLIEIPFKVYEEKQTCLARLTEPSSGTTLASVCPIICEIGSEKLFEMNTIELTKTKYSFSRIGEEGFIIKCLGQSYHELINPKYTDTLIINLPCNCTIIDRDSELGEMSINYPEHCYERKNKTQIKKLLPIQWARKEYQTTIINPNSRNNGNLANTLSFELINTVRDDSMLFDKDHIDGKDKANLLQTSMNSINNNSKELILTLIITTTILSIIVIIQGVVLRKMKSYISRLDMKYCSTIMLKSIDEIAPLDLLPSEVVDTGVSDTNK